jgi:hypothetical protein
VDVHGIGNPVDEPAQHLAPEVFVRLILDGDRRIHLPVPGVLDGEGNGLAAPYGCDASTMRRPALIDRCR